MLKEISIIILILIIIIGGDILIQQYLEKSSEPIIQNLETLSHNIEDNEENINKKESRDLINEIEKQWEDINKMWTMVVMHSELDQIELALIGTKTAINTKNVEDASIEVQKSIFLINHIKERDAFKIKNIL